MARPFKEALASNPVTIDGARRSEKARRLPRGIPSKPGLYVWWLVSPDALPAVHGHAPAHPTEPGLAALYVGVAPREAASRETLRSRTLKKHVGSGLADSTFRRSLAALLWEKEGWTPRLTEKGRFKLSPEDDAALRAWQEQNLRLSRLEIHRPWENEPLAIRELEPPFNLADNGDHPFYETMDWARRRFKMTAEALARRSA